MEVDLADYKQVPDYKNYFINEEGDLIRPYKNGKVKHLKFFLNDNGYLRINLSKNGKVKPYYKHQLLARTFLENPENKPCVDHDDRCRTNNSLSNLKWATHAENNRNKSCRYDNNTGIRGVSFVNESYYVANWNDLEGKHIRKKFSVRKYGIENARRLAIEARKEAEDLYYNY